MIVSWLAIQVLCSIEIVTDNQALEQFFSTPKLSRKEEIWLENLGNRGIFQLP